MAFKQVFYALREVFPQVDLRILKAVASQYSSDVDAAVGFVYSDVLPAVSEPTETHYALEDIDYAEHAHTDSKKPNLHSGRIPLVDLGAQEDASVLFGCAVKHEGQMPLRLSNAEDSQTSKNLLDVPTIHTLSKANDNYDLQVLFENIDNTGKESGVLRTAENPPELNNLANDDSFHNLFAELSTVDKTTETPSNFPGKGGSDRVHKEEPTLIHSNNCGTFNSTCNFNDDKHFVCPIVELDAFRPNEECKMPGAHKSEGILDISTHSYHITDLNKNISDTTKSKMKEVELQEENSRLAKQNANKAHQNYLAMVEHFNQLIKNSKESNDKQAQVVGEEKCLLVALTQDLQSRLAKLSAQRDEALATVQECFFSYPTVQIKCELDARLATSMEEEATALEDIMQKEKVSLLVRKDKESTVGSIMEESRKLQKEAEENILLRGLLLDQGRLIDIMQGEISNIHANVVAMKERISGSKLKSALVLTSCSAHSYHKDDCKSASVDTDWPMGNVDNRIDLPQEEITRSLAKDHTTSSDDDEGWEVLETNNA
ncbi:hypothetical protein ACQ4PT_000161 [Festuca glaucescens]